MTVYLVGAGPGDPGLITVRGMQVLSRADVVVYDRLSVASLLDAAPPTAERISVGKRPGHSTMPQEQINALLVERGRAGHEVVRLKGGDPFVFARGGEEARALIDAGVDFEVVPGVTSAVAVPAYAGIPVTMRHSSTSLHIITGHEDPNKDTEVDWEAAARLGGTIVILMGVARIGAIAQRLMAGGLPGDTPVAAVRWGTRPEQHTVRATLATIGSAPLEAPATIVVGRVAALDLGWYERRPLFGRRIVVTRSRHQASRLSQEILELGGLPVEVPTIEIADPADGGEALRSAAERVREYDWVVVTSANTVPRLVACLRDARDLAGVQVAAIGQGTAEALVERGIRPDLVPPEFVAESLLDVFPTAPSGRAGPSGPAGRVLVPRAAVAREVLPAGLRERGWEVDVVEAYRTVAPQVTEVQRRRIGQADVITFTASSTVTNFVDAFGTDGIPPVVACIGPVTAATARERGLTVDIEAQEHSIPGLVTALVQHLGSGPDS